MDKILIITYRFLPDVDGGIIVAYDYANLLVNLGYDVTVISKDYSHPVQDLNFKYIQVPNKYGKYAWIYNFRAFLKSFEFAPYKHIILNQCPITFMSGRFFDQKTLGKSISLIQGLEVEYIYENKGKMSGVFHSLFRMKHYHRKALIECRKIVSVSNFHMQKVIKASNLFSYANKFQVVHTGIDKDIFHFVKSDFKKEYGLEGKEILITVSRIEKMKGFLEMLSVFKSLISQNDQFKWVIIGDGPFLEEFKSIVKLQNIADHILFLGLKMRTELKYYYSAADCFWLLSNYDECLPLVYLEAQSCGIPAIGRNKGGVVETIANGRTGFLINNETECLDLILNMKYKSIDKEDLCAFAKQFDKVKAAEDLIS